MMSRTRALSAWLSKADRCATTRAGWCTERRWSRPTCTVFGIRQTDGPPPPDPKIGDTRPPYLPAKPLPDCGPPTRPRRSTAPASASLAPPLSSFGPRCARCRSPRAPSMLSKPTSGSRPTPCVGRGRFTTRSLRRPRWEGLQSAHPRSHADGTDANGPCAAGRPDQRAGRLGSRSQEGGQQTRSRGPLVNRAPH